MIALHVLRLIRSRGQKEKGAMPLMDDEYGCLAYSNKEKNPMGTMETLDELAGDTKIMWNPDNRDEVQAARLHFQSLRSKHYLAFRAIGEKGDKGEQMDTFDEHAGRIIMVPRMVGG
jgi:hypothetical protein